MFLRRAILSLAIAACPASAQQPTTAKTYVIVHGAWGGSWDWQTVDSMLTARGHHVHRISLTGLGDRSHLSSSNIGLDTHISDVANHLTWENLRDVVLIGHSYGGMVITGAADRVPERVRRLVYIDAMLPDSGESVMSIMNNAFVKTVRANVKDGMIQPGWNKPDEPLPRDVAQSLKTFTDTLHIGERAARIPGTYILTYQPAAEPDLFQAFADRAKARGWTVHRMRANHVPQRSAPRELTELLLQIH
jgi:pimeloyl-ACP methyl ester carboxylesterase